MRKPSGYGSVYKLKGKRRNPWTAVVTREFTLQDNHAVQKRSYLGYYKTRKEAEMALAKYNQMPYDPQTTFADVYKAWSEEKYPTISHYLVVGYKNAYKRFEKIHGKKFSALKTKELENIILLSDTSDNNKSMMKYLINQMYKYAVKYDIVQFNLAERFTVESAETKIVREVFTDDEIRKLIDSKDDEAKVILIMIYTGIRINEAYYMEILPDRLKGGSKTDSGRDRIVPVRDELKPYMGVLERYRGERGYKSFYAKVSAYCKTLGHRTHDCRVTFSTMYKDTNPTIRKLILGHKIDDLTERIYTKYTFEELKTYLDSIPFL